MAIKAEQTLDQIQALARDAADLRGFIHSNCGQTSKTGRLDRYRYNDDPLSVQAGIVDLMGTMIIEAAAPVQGRALAHMISLPGVQNFIEQQPDQASVVLRDVVPHLSQQAQPQGVQVLANLPVEGMNDVSSHRARVFEMVERLPDQTRGQAVSIVAASERMHLPKYPRDQFRYMAGLVASLPENDPRVLARAIVTEYDTNHGRIEQDVATLVQVPGSPDLGLAFLHAHRVGTPQEIVGRMKEDLGVLKVQADSWGEVSFALTPKPKRDYYETCDAMLDTCRALHTAFGAAAAKRVSADPELAGKIAAAGALFDPGKAQPWSSRSLTAPILWENPKVAAA